MNVIVTLCWRHCKYLPDNVANGVETHVLPGTLFSKNIISPRRYQTVFNIFKIAQQNSQLLILFHRTYVWL